MPDIQALLSVFTALPGAYLLLSADLMIEAASDVYLASMLTSREKLLGYYLFDAFPDNPAAPEAQAVHTLSASLSQVLATKQEHEMSRQRYDVPDPEHPGQFVERHWVLRNIPVVAEQGHVSHILHLAVDVTAQVQEETLLQQSQVREQSALAEAEAQRNRLHTLITQVPALIAVLAGPEHLVELANDGFRQMFGGRELVGKSYRQAVPELADQPFFDLLDEVYRTGQTYYGKEELAYINQTNTGQREALYFNFIYQATRDAAGAVNGILIFAYEVGEQIWARQQVHLLNQQLTASNEALEARVLERTQALEKAQKESERQRTLLENLFMHAPAAICILGGPNLVYELTNPNYLELFGGQELLGKTILEAFPEMTGHEAYRTLWQVYETGMPHEEMGILVPILRPSDGVLVERYFNYIQQPRVDEYGQVDGVLVFAFEVTGQVEARQREEQARQVSEATTRQLQLLTDALPVLISYVDQARTYQFVNRAYEEWFHHRPAEMLGQPVRNVLGEEAYARVEGYITQALAGEPVNFVAELPYRKGLVRHVSSQYVPDVREDTVVGFYALVIDVTEQVEARQQVQQLNQELATINAELQTSNQELLRNHIALARSQQDVLAAAQRQVQQRETFYQVFEQTPASIGLLRGPKHRFEYVNAAYQQLFPGRELVGRPVAEALPETVDQGFLALIDTVYRTGETFFGTELPLTVEQPDGQPTKDVYFTFTYQAYRENGGIAGVSIFAYDVTEQVLARKGREVQQQQLYELFMQAPAPIVILDGPDLVFQLVNPAYQLLFPGRELLHRPLLEALPELVGTLIPDALRQVYTTGETYVALELPLMLARHEGGPLEEMYSTFTYQPRRTQGMIDGIMVFAYDVTEQVHARRVVEAREQSFRHMADNVPAMLWETDLNGECTYLNRPWYAFTGQTPAEALGKGWTNAIYSEDHEKASEAFVIASTQHTHYYYQYRLRRHDGAYRWVIDSGHPHFSEQGEFIGMVGTVIDIHEQKLAELALQRRTEQLRKSRDKAQALNAELRESNEQLVRTNVDLDNFIYTASHDLKAPITNIEGLLHTLQGELPPQSQAGEVSYILELMQDSVDRFTRTIEHLTDVSKLQKEHGQPVSEVALATVIEDVRLDLIPLIQQVKGRVQVEVRNIPSVLFPEKNLRSVVYNLLSNALKYHHPSRLPEVSIRGHLVPGYFVLEVQDNGLGLDLSREQQLFTMFRRYHTHVEGSGIGLYMVKRMVENAGGRIEVQSELGVGSTFTVYFKR